MKTALTFAVLLALGSGAVMAEETKQAPIKMTAAEMGKVVAGALQVRARDGTGVNHAANANLYLGTKGQGGGTGTCKQ